MKAYASVLSEDAEQFVLAVAAVSEETDGNPFKIAVDALVDAVARLQKDGQIGIHGTRPHE